MKIVFFSSQAFEIPYFEAIKNQHEFIYHHQSLNPQTTGLLEAADGICVFVHDVLDATVIAILQQFKIRYIFLRCAGFNNVDLVACHQAHIMVSRVPRYSPHAVAEHALALLLCLNRKIHKAYSRIKEGNFSVDGLQGVDLYQKNVGIVGLGAIGQVFAKICHGLGCHVLAYDPIPTKLSFVQSCSLNELLELSDIISLHCPLNQDSYHILNAASFNLIKKTAILINTGRGALIDSQALIDALKKHQIAAVGLDVYEQESEVFYGDHSMDVIQDDLLMRLTTFPNVLITSHQGFLTEEALKEIAATTLDNITACAAHKIPKNAL